MIQINRILFTAWLGFATFSAYADGTLIDKIYHPYVQPGEREIEFRSTIQTNDDENKTDGLRKYQLGYAHSLSDRLLAEFYVIATDSPENDFDVDTIEAELLWQLTEQGEYAFDWGMLFELERSLEKDSTEISTGLLVEKEWGRYSGTANVHVIYEWGSDIKNELETGLALQARYRYSRELQPAIEFFSGENSKGIGPMLLGDIRLEGRQQLHWEAGVIAGLSESTPDATLKLLIEYEF